MALVAGTLTMCFDLSYQSYLPRLVERAELGEANAKLEVSRSTAQVAGPGLAGVLVGVFSAPYAILVDAASFVGSALFLSRIRRPESLREASGDVPLRFRAAIGEGLRFVVQGVIPLGSLMGGALGSAIGLRPTILIGAVGAVLAILPMFFSPLMRIKTTADAEEIVQDINARFAVTAGSLNT